MAKLAVLLAAVFGVLLVVATAHRTTITTVEVEEETDENQRGEGSCQEQLQRAQQLNHCQDFLREQSRGGGGRFGRRGSEYEPGSEFDPSGRYGPGREFEPGSRGMRRRESSDHFQPCCNQLRQVEDRCRCDRLRDIVRRLQGQVGSQQIQEVAETARQLPQMCGLGQTCQQIRAVYM